MGNAKSEESKQFEVKINHPKFTKAKIISSNNEKYLQTQLALDQKEFDKWKLATSKYHETPYNLLLPIKSSFSRTAMCGHTGNATVHLCSMQIDYHNYPYLLTEEIYDRRGKKTRSQEVQIWFLLYSMVRARNQAIQINQSLVDIRPSNIFLNEDGRIKVACSLSWPLEISNIQKAMDKEPTYLAPEDLERISRNQLFDGPGQLAQAFSMGLTALSVGNLICYDDLYDLKNNNFDVMRFNEAIGLWRANSGYSEVLRGTVSLLCNINPERRMSVTELNDLLLKHHDQIEQKVNFVVDNAPQKLHEQIMSARQSMAPTRSTYQRPTESQAWQEQRGERYEERKEEPGSREVIERQKEQKERKS